MSKNCFTANPETTRQSYSSFGVVMIVLGAVGAIFGSGFLGTIVYGLGLAVSGVFVMMSAGAMPAKTRAVPRLCANVRAFSVSSRWPKKTASEYSRRTTQRFSGGFCLTRWCWASPINGPKSFRA